MNVINPYRSSFKINSSFLFDGVNESFSIPNAALLSLLSGSTCKFSISAMVYLNAAGVNTIIGNWISPNQSFTIYIHTDGRLFFTQRSSATTKNCTSVETLATSAWHFITVNFDYSKSLGLRGEIFANGVQFTTSDNLGAVVDTPTTYYKIGTYNNSNFLNGNLVLISINNLPMTLSEHINFYNNGKPKNPQILFGANCKYFFNPDNSGSTAQFTVTDSVNSITATSVNLEDSDKTTTTPY